MSRKKSEQLGSVLDWLVAKRRSRAWLAEQLGHPRMWASRLFRGEVACSVPVLIRLVKLTGLDMEQLARECLR